MEQEQAAILAVPKAANEKPRFDDVLNVVGSFGRYQILITAFVILPSLIPSGFLDWALVFLTDTPSAYICSIPGTELNVSHLAEPFYRNMSSAEKCCARELESDNATSICIGGNAKTAPPCSLDNFLFDRSEYDSTLVTEYSLVCARKYLRSTARTVSAVGGLFGPMIWSFVADRFGRKRGFFLCVAFQSIFSIATGLAPSYDWFCVFRFCTGMTTSASYTIPYDILIELTGPGHRGLLSILSSISWTIGCLIFLLIAYLVRQWRNLALASGISAAILYLILFPFFPESPRWLLAHHSYDKLEAFLLRVAKFNRRPLNAEFRRKLPDLLRSLDSELGPTQKRSFLDLCRTPNLLKKTLILVFLNICNKGVSRGLNQYAPSLHDVPYFSVFLTILIGLPALFLAKPAFDHLGRRFLLIVPLLVGAVACMLTAIRTTLPGLILGLSLAAKFCINFTYLTGKLVEGEIFPTVIRSEGHSLVSVLSSLAVWPVPYIVDLGLDYKVVPLMVFGSFCFVAAFLVFLLPETAGAPLPQTLEDGENFGKDVPWRERFRLFGRGT